MIGILVGCERPRLDAEARLAEARPQLGAAAQVAREIAAGQRRCESPLPSYPGCEHDHQQVLLLAPFPPGETGAGTRLDGLLYVPDGRRAALAMTLWHFDSLGAALGHGWHQVVAVSHVD
jgi:hypothetical protein